MPAPLVEGFIGALGESEISHPREAVLDTIMLVGGEKFQASQHTEHVRQIAADLVLAALTAIERHQQRVYPMATGLEGKQTPVFVVRMGYHLHQAGRRG